MADAGNNNQPQDESEQLEKFGVYEYETQFFGFTPKSFLDGGKQVVHELENLKSMTIACLFVLSLLSFLRSL